MGRHKVSKVSYGRNGGLEFIFNRGPYDRECRDYLYSTENGIENSINLLRRQGYSDPEIEKVFDAARQAVTHFAYGSSYDPIYLPRPVKVTVKVD